MEQTILNYNKLIQEFNILRHNYNSVDHYSINHFGLKYRTCTIHRMYFSPTTFLNDIKYVKKYKI